MEPFKFQSNLADYETAVEQTLSKIDQERIMARIWDHDHTVWKPDPAEISNRLGWLHLPETMLPHIADINKFVTAVRQDGFTHVLLLGMGGSSLAPELFANIFGSADGLQLSVLDSTDPGYVLTYARNLPLAHTLFIVATKSGGTVETLSFFKYFYNCVQAEVGAAQAGRHFVAITDPGSKLESLAKDYQFRQTFLNDPNIGGRYSALSHFGLVPAALVGVDIEKFLARATAVVDSPIPAQIGAIMGTLAEAGRDKLTFVLSPSLRSFGDWVEQLIAESSGKQGKGILPVVGEPPAAPELYGNDRLFVTFHFVDDRADTPDMAALQAARQPMFDIGLHDLYDLGAQFLVWELATAVAGYVAGIHPFNQPNVEAAKNSARKMVAAYNESGELPAGESVPVEAANLTAFLAAVKAGDYVTLQAYVTPEAQTEAALQQLRIIIRDQYKVATTVGYGPRFLHSTGQLHKGDGGNGLFVQFTSDPQTDVAIPDKAGAASSSMTFGVLEMAQALGDGEALQNEGRRFIRFHLGQDAAGNIRKLIPT